MWVYSGPHPGLELHREPGCLARKQSKSSGSALAGQSAEMSAVKGLGIWGSFKTKDGVSDWGSKRVKCELQSSSRRGE